VTDADRTLADVSVVIPVFNRSTLLPRALSAVLRQTLQAREVLVVDDGSAEDVAAAAAAFTPPVRVVRKSNGGAGSARNVGIEQAAGSFIAFLDSDDYWEPDKLFIQMEALGRNGDVGLVTGDWYEQAPGGARSAPDRKHRFAKNTPLRLGGDHLVDFVKATWTSCVVVRREALGSDRFSVDLPTGEDRDLWIRLLARTSGYYVATPLATAVLEPHSLSRGDPDCDYPNMLAVVTRNRHLIGNRASRRWERQILRAWAAAHVGRGAHHRALQVATSRLIAEPWNPESWWIVAKAMRRSLKSRF